MKKLFGFGLLIALVGTSGCGSQAALSTAPVASSEAAQAFGAKKSTVSHVGMIDKASTYYLLAANPPGVPTQPGVEAEHVNLVLNDKEVLSGHLMLGRDGAIYLTDLEAVDSTSRKYRYDFYRVGAFRASAGAVTKASTVEMKFDAGISLKRKGLGFLNPKRNLIYVKTMPAKATTRPSIYETTK